MNNDGFKALAQLAREQRGLFSVAQAAQFGVPRVQLCRAVSTGLLRRSRRGVYAMSGTPPSRWEPVLAAALVAGPGAVISHSSAAAIHGLYAAELRGIELSRVDGAHVRLAGVTVHRHTLLSSEDCLTRHGVAITSPARTLVDVAPRVSPALLERMLDEGCVARVWTVAAVRACVERLPLAAPGRGRVARLLSLRDEAPDADSVLEARVFRALRPLAPFEHHFLMSVGNSVFNLDVAWPDQKVTAEIIGRAHRVASRSAFERERRKLNALAHDGWRIVHLTAGMSADEMVASVRGLLTSSGQ